MEKKHTVLLVGLVVLQLFTLARLSSLQQEMGNRFQQVQNLVVGLDGSVSGIYGNVERMLREEASLLDSSRTTFGELDPAGYTVPATVEAVPKEYSEGMEAFLQAGEARSPMVRSGTVFTGTVEVPVFETVDIQVVLREGESFRSETVEAHLSLKEKFLLQFNGGMEHASTTGSKGGKYLLEGNLHLSITGGAGNGVRSLALVQEVDGRETGRETVDPTEFLGRQVELEMELGQGQSFVFLVEAVDSYGLLYRHRVHAYDAGGEEAGTSRYKWGEEGTTILDQEGNVLHPKGLQE
ncbi:hypothetical protein [Anaerotalea alkaliphila]|uniref:Uncharacterized protein n=1 Tax=Anaerotalea alkaliphila TaxID=2662126 RepID=A0A7X5HX69_9FIRM|nr:hypothetical protein [Anaerotalea alkaliphila]NDL68265.1 hypothetical protein [Anaerotalea alkaliphila]